MFHFLCKKLLLNSPPRLPIRLLQTPSLKSLSQTTQPSYLIQYLTNSCLLSPERALSVAKKLKDRTPPNPDSVLTFLRNHGFSKTHISNLILKLPGLLFSRVELTLRPKMKFFKETGLSDSDIIDFLSSHPFIFYCNLEKKIKPLFCFLHSISSNNEAIVKALKRSNCLFRCSLDKVLVPNVTLLQNYNVPNSLVSRLIMVNPRVLTMNPDRFLENAKLVEQMGFDPSRSRFVYAVLAMGMLSRSTWKARFEAYRSLGWSDEEILAAFRRQPSCITISEEKLRKMMGFFMKELGWNPSYLSVYPVLLLLNLEKRIVPRHKVLQVLKSKGLALNGPKPVKSFFITEKQFLKDYVFSHCKMVPEILKVYRGEVGFTRTDGYQAMSSI